MRFQRSGTDLYSAARVLNEGFSKKAPKKKTIIREGFEEQASSADQQHTYYVRGYNYEDVVERDGGKRYRPLDEDVDCYENDFETLEEARKYAEDFAEEQRINMVYNTDQRHIVIDDFPRFTVVESSSFLKEIAFVIYVERDDNITRDGWHQLSMLGEGYKGQIKKK